MSSIIVVGCGLKFEVLFLMVPYFIPKKQYSLPLPYFNNNYENRSYTNFRLTFRGIV